MRRFLAILASVIFLGSASAVAGERISMSEYQKRYPKEFELRKCLESNHDQFLEMVETTLLAKIAVDIDRILERGWADEVGPQDLFHAHLVLRRDRGAEGGCLAEMGGDNIKILFHAHESDGRSGSKTRNIVSTRLSEPQLAHPPHYSGGPYTVQGEDLDGWYGINVYFGDTLDELEPHKRFIARGPYKIGGRTFGFRSLIRYP
ncbi:MAG: hypothetical protein AAB036_02975 [Elusimicrobiota bacterium]